MASYRNPMAGYVRQPSAEERARVRDMHRAASVRGMEEPPHGSVLMAHSETGTAYQRHFADGLYHGTNGDVLTFAELKAKSPVYLRVVYRAPEVEAEAEEG